MPLRDFAERYPALTERLKQAKLNNRIAHGYLLIGDQDELLADFADAFLQLSVCENLQPDGDACGECKSCKQIVNGSYPHGKEIKPQSKSRQIRLEDIYELEHFLHLTSGGATRIATVHSAERMNVQTQNAFLKTLEEPSPNTIIMMMTCTPSLLLPTIRSRCQTIALLDNRVVYDLLEPEQFFRALSLLRPEAGAQAATEAADILIQLLAEIRAVCEAESKSQLAELTASTRELEPAMRKQQKEEAEALLESQYRGKRELFLSAIHTWFGQEYIRANGVDSVILPNKEFYEELPEAQPPGPREARRSLQLTEKLLETLNYNVDEKLAIDDFCQTLCQK